MEVPLDDELERRLDALAARGLGAKVRCGGAVVPDERTSPGSSVRPVASVAPLQGDGRPSPRRAHEREHGS